jgi:peptidoglycan/LPS O-acetylase OafA/YrhL
VDQGSRVGDEQSVLARRDLALDGIRGIAISLVLMVHVVEIGGDGLIAGWLNAIARSGWLGVDLFFVLSGYLITRILLETREQPGYFRNFYARRALRIFPAYYLYLLIVWLVVPHWIDALRGPDADAWLLPSAFYVQNIVMVADGTATAWRGLDHLWSLAIEEQFYLLWPLLLWKVPARYLQGLCLAMIALAWGCKLALIALHDWPMAGYVLMPTRMDALAAGAWVAVRLHDGHPQPIPKPVLAAVGIAFMVLVALFVRDHGLRLHGAPRIGIITSAAALVFAAAVYVCVRHDLQPRILLAAPLQVMGRYSYGIYLIHLAVIEMLQVDLQARLLGSLGPNTAMAVSAAVTVAVTVALAALSFHLYERPFLRLKRHFERQPVTTGAVQGTG